MVNTFSRLFLVSGFLFCLQVHAQKVSNKTFLVEINPECMGSEEPKAMKQLEVARDRKKNDKAKRMDALRKAIEEDPNCAEAHYCYGLELLRTALMDDQSIKNAEFELSETVRICSDFHSEPYYFLASIALGKADYEKAVTYFEKYNALSNSSQVELDEEREATIQLDYEFAKFFRDAYKNPVPFAPEKVKGVTTDENEYLPLISPDNQSMLLTRQYTIASKVPDGIMAQKDQYLERFVKAKRVNGLFDIGETLPSPFNENESYNYGGASLSLDNKTIYVTICAPSPGGYSNCDIYTADLEYKVDKETGILGYHWTPLKNLGSSVNTPDGWESQPSISADGMRLYFCSARAESRGIDIYYADKNEFGEFGNAVNIGEPINTPYNDKTPYMHSDSRTLYFASDGGYASDGHLGFGGYDVFLTRQNEDGTWTKPTNLGHPINTEGDEQAFVVSTDGKRVYYSAKDPKLSQSIDIWSFELYKEARPDKLVFVKGNIKDEQGDPARDATIELKSMQSKGVTQVKVDADDGAYAAVIAVRDNEDVVLTVKADGMAFQSRLIETSYENAPKTTRTGDEEEVKTFQEFDLKVEEVKEGGVYRIDDIYYGVNSSKISEKSKAILDEFMSYLKENKSIRVAIHGHTDNVGKPQANLALSTDRAFSVKQYLESKGISGSRIEYKGFGETVPFASNDTPQGRALNRRTEFVVLSK
jgi:outer membrane protein OmpA-like peptidoglycan-associated protein/tetratricopeptide (TPR) repeat protein